MKLTCFIIIVIVAQGCIMSAYSQGTVTNTGASPNTTVIGPQTPITLQAMVWAISVVALVLVNFFQVRLPGEIPARSFGELLQFRAAFQVV